ncbi:MAG: hypothetical protein CMN41_06705 [SAR116 cluster bacterium]|nr:hypothetical protein [SAR116 cluster bacterium]HBP59680.1 hypothetical protein [Alphaproteobacteria bacterium]
MHVLERSVQRVLNPKVCNLQTAWERRVFVYVRPATVICFNPDIMWSPSNGTLNRKCKIKIRRDVGPASIGHQPYGDLQLFASMPIEMERRFELPVIMLLL